MWGKLSFDALPHDPFTIGALLGTGVIGVIGVLVLLKLKGFAWFITTAKYLWKEWFTSLDAKKIGIMYIAVAVFMLLRGLADAMMLRAHQALTAGDAPGILSTETYQQVFTAHGTIMIFFVAMGLVFGIINLILPLQLGARDVAFPFLNNISFWLFAAGTVLINLSLVLGEFAATGWLAYPPLSGIEYSPGVGVDYWIWSLQIAGVGSLLSGINFFVTILKMRAPGMTLMKMPIFAWSVLCTTVLVMFAFPILTATLGMLSLDRLLGMHFFTSDFGGNPMMYVNLIWAWGHPEVYILILPAFGIFSEIIATYSRKALFGYASMVYALIAIAVLSFIVWLHHFFTMGAGANVNAFFGIMTMIIGVPTGVKIFNWLFTMFRGKVVFDSPMLWFMGFVTTFTIGGAAGVLMAVPAVDFQLHNSLFLVAHFHTMIVGGVLFGMFAGLTYWFPKIFGFRLHDGLGKAAFWAWIIGFILAFVPLYILGIMGATRRLDNYDASLGWQELFVVAAIGLVIISIGAALQVLQLLVSIINRKKYRDTTGDPWNGRTLEWSVSSPAPHYNFAVIPKITTRDQFWHNKQHPRTSEPVYKDIHLPKNTAAGMMIALSVFIAGFAIIWHMWWLAALGATATVVVVIIRTLNDEHEYVIPAAEVKKHSQRHHA